MLPILVQHLSRDRERLGVSEGHMAWLLGITRPQYRELEAGRLHISNAFTCGSWTCAGGLDSRAMLDRLCLFVRLAFGSPCG